MKKHSFSREGSYVRLHEVIQTTNCMSGNEANHIAGSCDLESDWAAACTHSGTSLVSITTRTSLATFVWHQSQL